MKTNRRLLISLATIIITVYAIIYYWSSAERLLQTLFAAATPFIGGAMVAYVVNILMSGYERTYLKIVKHPLARKLSRGLSMFLAYFTLIFLIIFLLGTVLPELVTSVQSMVSQAPKAITNLITQMQENQWVNETLVDYFGNDARTEVVNQLTGYVQTTLRSVGTILLNLLTSVTELFSVALNILVSLVFSLYVLASKENLGQQFNRLIKAYIPKAYEPFENVRQVFHSSFRSFFVGQTLEAIILGVLVFIGMQIFNFPYAPTISILIGFTALLPVVGAYIGVTIGVILILTQSFTQAVWFLVFVIILQQFEGNLIYPRVVGNSVGLPGMWVIMAITIGGALGGLLGMLVAVPFFAACYKLVRQDVESREAKKEADAPVAE